MEHYKNKSLEDIVEVIDGITYTEEWRDIEGYVGLYKVSNFGRIKSAKRMSFVPAYSCKERTTFGHYYPIRERILKPHCAEVNQWYVYPNLTLDAKNKTHKMHILVAQAFIPNPENKPQVNHKYGITWDNRAWHLEWATNSENQLHAIKLGLRRMNEKNPNSKHTNEQIIEVKKLLKIGVSPTEISVKTGVNRHVIGNIKYLNAWKHIII